MTEQLQHQDPLKPMDNTQMVAQMAQMSTVQGITDLNKTVKGFQESMASDQVLRGAALVGLVTFGSLSGSMLPFILKRLGFDPASASAPFVATLVDVTGLVIYFSIAAMILHGTLL
ncbi:hypothetical protein G6F59_018383 [Rhizopus arrhizus]|nr:hypothetical protein G6F59_018383 [Rhizopus arrhizus]